MQGGGLVSGDTIDLTIKLDSKTHLVLLTQGNTKVFRERPGGTYTPAEPATSRLGTFQRMVVDVQPAASLFLLPAPVTCFENSIYSQHQTFHLADDSTLLLLDWFTSGRLSRGESWAFERYRSCNEVCIGGVKVVNDVLLLEGKDFRKRMSHYACYCTVLLCGPGVADLLQHFRQLVRSLRQYKRNEPDGFIWSFSELEDGKAGIVRCAGLETETVKNWLAIQLVGLREIIGLDTYKAAFV